jgi:hypothetical protein
MDPKTGPGRAMARVWGRYWMRSFTPDQLTLILLLAMIVVGLTIARYLWWY